MNTKLIFIIAIALLFLGCVNTTQTPPQPSPAACTQEAKICPDGSAVVREGPNCEFAPCPPTINPIGSLPPNNPVNSKPAASPIDCDSLLRPQSACGSYSNARPYYLGLGETITVENGDSNFQVALPSIAAEQFECHWYYAKTLTEEEHKTPAESFANFKSAAIKIQVANSEYIATNLMHGFLHGRPASTIQNNELTYESHDPTFAIKTRDHVKADGNYFIWIHQNIGDNVTTPCTPQEEDAILATFHAP